MSPAQDYERHSNSTVPHPAAETAARASQLGEVTPGPTVTGAIGRNRFLVATVTLVIGLGVFGYTLQQPKVFDARASIAVVPPAQDQALGTVNPETPDQYQDSQLILLQSPSVAAQAASLANTKLREKAFTTSDFNGPNSSLKVAVETSTGANPSSIVDITFSAHSAAKAAAGANAVLGAYQSVRVASTQNAYASVVSALDSTLQQVNAELASGGPNGQLNAALTAERADLVQRRTLALVDESLAASQPPPEMTAYAPTSATNHQLVRNGLLGAVVGFLIGVIWAYAREARRRRTELSNSPVLYRGTHDSFDRRPVMSRGWESWNTGNVDLRPPEQNGSSSSAPDDRAIQAEVPRSV